MYQILATKMAISTSGGDVTQPVPMQGANAVVVDVTVFSGTLAASGGVKLQGSNDLENWIDLNATMNGASAVNAGAAYLPGTGNTFTAPQTSVATQYVRLWFKAGTAAVIACGINTSQL